MSTQRVRDGSEVVVDPDRLPRIKYLTYEDADESTRKAWDEVAQMIGAAHHATFTPADSYALSRTLLRHPDLCRVFEPFVLYVKTSTNLPLRHRELAILRSAWRGGVDDQWVNHTQIGMDCGLDRAEIDRIAVGPDAPGWSAEEAAVLRAVDELHDWCRIGDETWSALARIYDERQLVEFLLLVGNYRTLSYIQNSVGIRPVTGTSPNLPGNRFLFTSS